MKRQTEEQTKSYVEHSHRNFEDIDGNPIKPGFYVSKYTEFGERLCFVYPGKNEFLVQFINGKEYTICYSRHWTQSEFPSFRLKPCNIGSILKEASETFDFIVTGLRKLEELVAETNEGKS